MRALFFLVVVFALSATPVVAGDPDPTPLPVLIEQAKKALAEEDEKTFDDLLGQLFVRITGFQGSSSAMPEGVSDDLYIQRMCEYDRVADPITTPELRDVMRHQLALIAYSVVHEGSENHVSIRAVTECVHEDGHPTATTLMMRDGIAWAKALRGANAEEALKMVKAKEALASKHPRIRELALLAKLSRYDAEDKKKVELKKGVKPTERIFPKAILVDKADRGDLASQLEVARRLETGDKFQQDNAMAFFWYTRALKNGGGEAAQAAMDRLLPHLDAGHLMSIDIWTRRGHRPY